MFDAGKMFVRCGVVAICTALALATPSATAGELQPPPGPVNPTGPVTINPQSITLPYTITKPGSYVLTGNIEAPGGYAGLGIQINADDVTLDLNGFAMIGDGAGAAIFANPGRRRYAILNGSISNWGSAINTQSAEHGEISNIRATDSLSGAILTGRWTIVKECVTHNAGNVGIQGSDGCVITDCIASNCTGVGINGGFGSVIRGCSAYNNGLFGITAGSTSVVADCSAFSNTSSGIRAGNSLIRGNVSRANGAPQIDALGTSTLVENH